MEQFGCARWPHKPKVGGSNPSRATMSTKKIEIARKNGIKVPELAWEAATAAGIPFWVLCAFLEQETSGGMHIYGHDVNADGSPRPFWGHGEVTRENYEAYKKERDLGVTRADRFPNLGRRSQGVGLLQLTHWTIQDRADANGGCWVPYYNLLTGAQIIKEYFEASNEDGIERWVYAARRFSGKDSYANTMRTRLSKWRDLIT